MADNLKPYDPNKGFISFRLNPESLKEDLISMIPYNRTLRYLHDNPEAPISETAKIAMSETPILGSLLAGEPVDAAKEAFLFGTPIKAPAKFKKEISKLPKDTQFKDIGYGELSAYSPTEGLVRKVTSDNGIFLDPRTSVKDFKSNPSPILNQKQIHSAVDNTNALEKLNKNNRLSFDSDKYSNLNPFNLDRLDDPAFANSIEGKVLQEALDLHEGYTGGYHPKNALKHRVINQKEAQLVSPHLKKTEQLYKDDFDNLYIKDRRGKYWYFQSDPYSGRIIDKYIEDNPRNPIPYSDPTLGADLNAWKAKVNQYNANRQFEDNYINYKDPEQWWNDRYDAERAYYDAIYGPFYEDIKKEPRN